MREPDIYTIKLTGYPEEGYVLWRDYERTKDYYEKYVVELVERLTNCKAEADRLKAEVERLNEAIVRGAIIPDPKPNE